MKQDEDKVTDLLALTTRNEGFAKRVQLELKRASRYRTFISLIIIDLSGLTGMGDISAVPMDTVMIAVRNNIRETDEVSLLDGDRVGLLTPETSRQGAEIAARRITELVKASVAATHNGRAANGVTMEIASFPDAGGNRTVAEFIEELAGNIAN